MNTKSETKEIITEESLKEKYPVMFSNPKAKDGEICIGEYPIEMAIMNEALKLEAGLSSVRMDIEGTLRMTPIQVFRRGKWEEEVVELRHHYLFASLEEFLKFLNNK